MRYTILLVALLFLASAFTFRLRSRAQAHLADCPAMDTLDQAYVAAGEKCAPLTDAYIEETGANWHDADIHYYSWIGTEMGLEGTEEAIDAAFQAAYTGCYGR